MNSLLAALVVVGGGIAYVSVGPAKSQAAVVPTAAVARGSVLETVSASGNIEAPMQVGVDFQTGGRVQAIDVQVCQSVQAGQVLAQVDPTNPCAPSSDEG